LNTDVSPNRPSVTIGLPVWNGEHYLPGCIDALLAQTYQDYELIISDNGSTDRTGEICLEYAARDPRIRYVRQPVNMGPFKNYNYLLDEAKGEYFMWAPVDDRWSPNFVEELHKTLVENADSVGAQGDWLIIGPDDEPLTAPDVFEEMQRDSRLGRILPLAWRHYMGLLFYGLFRTEVLRRFGMRSLPLAKNYARHCEYPVLYFLGSVGKIRTNRNAHFLYRRHPDQDSNRSYPLRVSLALELGFIIGVPIAVWEGCRSPWAAFRACLGITGKRLSYLGGQLLRLPQRLKRLSRSRRPQSSSL